MARRSAGKAPRAAPRAGGAEAQAPGTPFQCITGIAPARAAPWAVPGGAALAGLLAGLAAPGGVAPWCWVAVYTPLFLALDVLARFAEPGRSRIWWRALGACLLLGAVQAAWWGGWVVNTAHVYGGLPIVVAHLANLAGFGGVLGLEAFAFLAVPFLLARRALRWGLPVVVCWATAAQAYVPRFFEWSYGQFLHAAPWPAQGVDVVGSEGLNLPVLALHGVAFLWLRETYAPGLLTRRELVVATGGVALVFALASGYGAWRSADLAAATARGAPVNLVSLQPNFSLRYLASNPALTHSDRAGNLGTLVGDTREALARLRRRDGAPTVVVWPESVFPGRYLEQPRVRGLVEQWARTDDFHLVLATVDAAVDSAVNTGGPAPLFGASVHISPRGGPPEVYHKLELIPFGERIPLADWFPAYRRALRRWVANMSEFEAGTDYTLFSAGPAVRIAPLICFDIIKADPARGMAEAGANLGLVLANLAWFGRTNISDLFEFYARFRAMETRTPYLVAAQNGATVLLDAAGRRASQRLTPYEAGALTLTIQVPETHSFFVAFRRWIHAGYLLLALAALGAAWRDRRQGMDEGTARGMDARGAGEAASRD